MLKALFNSKKMGTVSSISKENNSRRNDSQNDSYFDYELKSESSIKNKFILKNQSSNDQSETTENTKIIDSNDKIPFKFEWKEGGNDVKISGSFLDNWKQQLDMKKNLKTGYFEIFLNIPKGIHQFKFIVDKKWACSSEYITINDKNNTNNIIDLLNFPANNIIENYNKSNLLNIKKKKKKSVKDGTEYNSIFPKASEVNVEAPGIPSHYLPCFDLNYQTNQEKIKLIFKKYLNYEKSKNVLENNDFKSIITIDHDKISHICYNVENNNDNNEKFIRTAITQRNKHKFLTIIYYTPKNDK